MGHSYSHSSTIAESPNDFALNTRLSNLSWQVAEGKVTIREAAIEFPALRQQNRLDARVVLLLVVAANAAFCRIFGGDWFAMIIVAVATLVGFISFIAIVMR